MTNKQLRIDNFSLGMRRDGSLTQDRMWSMRTLSNYDILYEEGRLKVRKGYGRWNTNVLPASGVATQLHRFEDMSSHKHLLGICNGDDRWYAISETGNHVKLTDEIATARRPIVNVDNRCFFGTDYDLYWTDDTAIAGATTNYRVGIERPDDTPGVEARNGIGNIVGLTLPVDGNPATYYQITSVLRRRAASIYNCTETKTFYGIMVVWMPHYTGGETGQFRLLVYNDVAGKPGSLISDDLATDWSAVLPTEGGVPVVSGTVFNLFLPFQKGYEFQSGTTYWIVVEGNSDYYTNYHVANFFICFASDAPAAGQAYAWNGSAWVADSGRLGFSMGGMADDNYYEYVVTYLNSTYGSESRPSRRSERIKRDTYVKNKIRVTWTAPSDGQIDKVRIYRRQVGTDPNIVDSEITDLYSLVGEAVVGSLLYDDTTEQDYVLGGLQTADHYLYDYIDEDPDSDKATAIIPAYIALWKGRIWLAPWNSNRFYYSKKLEEDGASGLTGDSIYDYFPLENYDNIPEPSDIVGIHPLSYDRLAFYMGNESVYIVTGADQPLNPPPDLYIQRAMSDNGLIAERGITEFSNMHVYMGRHGVHGFNGTGNIQYISEFIESVFSNIQNQYIDDSILASMGKEIWALVDDNNDGALESIYIYDTRPQINAWRKYSYGRALKDLCLWRTGGTFQTMLAADATTGYILELNNGTDDNGSNITALVETHNLRVPRLGTIWQVFIGAYYEGTPGTYTLTTTKHDGTTNSTTRTPSSNNDLAKHRIGISPINVTVVGPRIQSSYSAPDRDELAFFEVNYNLP